LLDIDGDLNANDVAPWQLRLHIGQEARDALSVTSLPTCWHLNVIAPEAGLQKLRIAALRRHLGNVVRPGLVVWLVVPIVKEACGNLAVLGSFLEEHLC